MKRHILYLKSVLLILLISACTESVERKSFMVTEEEYGKDWPFIVPNGRIICEFPVISFESEGKIYQLLPDSGKLKYEPIDKLLKESDDESFNKALEGLEVRTGASLSRLNHDAIEKCKTI